MGKLAGFGRNDVKMIRFGHRYETSMSEEATEFRVEVDPASYTETWSEGSTYSTIQKQNALFLHNYSKKPAISSLLTASTPSPGQTAFLFGRRLLPSPLKIVM
jgi:hypothetical protein